MMRPPALHHRCKILLTMVAFKTLVVFLSITLVLSDQPETAPNSCVSKGNDVYLCTNDPLFMRRALNQNNEYAQPRGVIQRVDGSEAERIAVREVLKRMDDYFIHEVMSKEDYEHVRSKCQNSNELCAFWASVGECETNRIFMLKNCAAACRFCLLANTNLV